MAIHASPRRRIPLHVVDRIVSALPRVAAAVSIVLGTLALAGWILDQPVLRSVIPGAVQMKANTGVGLVLMGIALLLLSNPGRTWKRATLFAGLLLAILGGATLGQYMFGWDFRIDEALFADNAVAFNAHRGRMSPYTAFAFLCTGAALGVCTGARARAYAWLLAIPVAALGGMSILGYLWNAQEIVTDRVLPPIAINTSVALLMAGLAILVVSWRKSDSAERESSDNALGLEGQIVVSLSIALLVLFIGGSYTYRATKHFDQSMSDVADTQEIRGHLNRLQSAVADAQTAQRDYLMSGDPRHRARFSTSRQVLVYEQASLNNLVANDPEQVQLLDRLNGEITELINTLESESVRYDSGGSRDLALITSTTRNDVLRESISQVFTQMDADQDLLLTKERVEARALRQFTLASLLLALTIATGFCVYLYRLVQRELMIRSTRRAFDERLHRAMSLFATTMHRPAVIDGTLRMLAELSPTAAASFYRSESGCVVREAACGLQSWLPETVALGDGPIGVAAAGQRPMATQLDEGPDASHLFCCPVIHFDQLVGMFVVSDVRALRGQERGFVAGMASKLGIALDNLEHYDRLKQMSTQLSEKNATLRQQTQELDQANRMKSEFLATMSHELRTPLNAIIGFAAVLRDGLVGTLTEPQHEYIGDIQSSGEHLLELINDILDLSKVEAGRMELDLHAVELPALLRNSLSMVREKAQAHRQVINVHLDGAPAALYADARKLKQIAYNLLSNAVKFTPDGGTIDLECRIVNTGTDVQVEISVADSGVGIAESDMARLFQPFVQIDGSLGKQYEGTGLGLAMVRRLAELHGGGVRVESKISEGSRFIVTIPFRGVDIEDDTQVTVSPPLDSKRPRPVALIVEDEDAAAELLRLQLETLGLEVIRAADANSAMQVIDVRKPDVITIDVLLGQSNGWDLLADIKRCAALAEIPVIVVSIIADSQKGRELGAASVLQKPVSRKELGGVLSALRLIPAVERPISALVVDDDQRTAQLFASYLRSAGCEVACTYNGRDALEHARRNHPDVIVLDLLMPGMSGNDVIDALALEPQTRDIPVLVVTAKALSASDRRALDAVSDGVIEKGALARSLLIHEVRETAVRAGER